MFPLALQLPRAQVSYFIFMCVTSQSYVCAFKPCTNSNTFLNDKDCRSIQTVVRISDSDQLAITGEVVEAWA